MDFPVVVDVHNHTIYHIFRLVVFWLLLGWLLLPLVPAIRNKTLSKVHSSLPSHNRSFLLL